VRLALAHVSHPVRVPAEHLADYHPWPSLCHGCGEEGPSPEVRVVDRKLARVGRPYWCRCPAGAGGMLNVAPGVVDEWYAARWDDDGSRRARARVRAAAQALDELQAWCSHPIRCELDPAKCGRCIWDLTAPDEAATTLANGGHAATWEAWSAFAERELLDHIAADAAFRRLYLAVHLAETAPALRRAIGRALARVVELGA
jgi:hypothetical protein